MYKILCGNEVVDIGVREEGGLGHEEMEIVDYFLGCIYEIKMI